MADMYQNKNRSTYFKKDERLEEALADLNDLIGNVPPGGGYFSDARPIILIMGCPRSGSTVMLQWLASLGIFSHPSNLIARFYKNPHIGIRVQQSILEFDPLNQMGFRQTEDSFKSSLGKTMGALSPSEFWYYWYQYFKFGENSQKLTENKLREIDGKEFINKLYAFEYLTCKPLVMKGMLLNWNIPYLYKLNPKFLFVNLARDPFFNAQSLLQSREAFFEDREKWYSFKPEEYDELKAMDPISQVAGQVVYTQKAVEVGLSDLPESNVLNIKYEDFCSNPKAFLQKLITKYNVLSENNKLKFEFDEKIQNKFTANSKVNLNEAEAEFLKGQISLFQNKTAPKL